MAPTTHYKILFGVGSGVFTVAFIVAVIVAIVWWVRRRRFDTAWYSAAQFFILMLTYWPMFIGSPMRQRKDGREIVIIRDITMIPVVMIQTWVVNIILHLQPNPATIILFLMGGGSLSFCLADFGVANFYWWGFAAGGAGLFLLAQLWTFKSAQLFTIGTIAVWASSAIILIGFYLIQMLGWSMLQVLDNSPHRLNTEIAYLIVVAVGAMLTGLLATIFFTPATFPLKDATPLPAQALPQDETQAVGTLRRRSTTHH